MIARVTPFAASGALTAQPSKSAAHRLLICAALSDRVFMFEHGELTESGTHEELLKTSAAYREICDSQLKEEGERP